MTQVTRGKQDCLPLSLKVMRRCVGTVEKNILSRPSNCFELWIYPDYIMRVRVSMAITTYLNQGVALEAGDKIPAKLILLPGNQNSCPLPRVHSSKIGRAHV